MNARQRIRTRLVLLRIRLRGSEQDRVDAKTILRNDEMLEAFGEVLFSRVEAQGTFTDFLDWLIENQEAIIELIRTIISLFSGGLDNE